jgi:hypothetical protein
MISYIGNGRLSTVEGISFNSQSAERQEKKVTEFSLFYITADTL